MDSAATTQRSASTVVSSRPVTMGAGRIAVHSSKQAPGGLEVGPTTITGGRDDATHRAAKSWQRRLKNNPDTLYRDPTIDANTLVAVDVVGHAGNADRRPVVDSQGRYFGRGREGRRRQVEHAQAVMSGEPASARPAPPHVPMAIPRTPLVVGAPHQSYPILAQHPALENRGGVLIPAASGVAEGRLRRRRPSAELRALDALYETKARGGVPRRFHHHLRDASASRTVTSDDEYLGHGPGYLSGRPGLKEEVVWETRTVPRGTTGASVARVRSEDG